MAWSRRKFLRFFPGGFRDPTYLDWERSYKWNAPQRWNELLGFTEYRELLQKRKFTEIATRALKIEARTILLFSFEKMANSLCREVADWSSFVRKRPLRFPYGAGSAESRFQRWVDVVAALPRKQTRVLTWPVLTVFGFIAQPETHIFLKPNVTRIAAQEYGFDFQYQSHPSWKTYANFLRLAETMRRDLRELQPRDMIDLQSFIWVLGSDEYEER